MSEPKNKVGGARRGAGRPPTTFRYDPTTIPGLRDQGRARAASSIPKLLRLWELQVEAGIEALEALGGGSAPQTGALGQRRVESFTDEQGREVRVEHAPYAGLDWSNVNKAAAELAGVAGFTKVNELQITGLAPPKLVETRRWRDPSGVEHEMTTETVAGPEDLDPGT